MADASILAAAETDYQHALAAFDQHIRDTGWNETCADCLSLQGHVNRTGRQVDLLTWGTEAEEVPLF